MSERNIFVRDTPDLYSLAAKWIRGAINTGISKGQCSVALAGGNTPRPVYELLAAAPLKDQVEWSKVSIYWGDERAVPPHDIDSNYAMAQDALLSRVPVPPSQVHRMEAEHPDRDAAARDYEQILPQELDVLILGVGPDGHTASIFPKSEALREHRRRVMAVVGTKPPPNRMTITPPVIEAARDIVVIATGADKALVIARTLDGPTTPIELPMQYARRGAWFLDKAAASMLRGVT